MGILSQVPKMTTAPRIATPIAAASDDPEVFADHYFPAANGFAHQREHGSVFDFFIDRFAGREEGRQQDQQKNHVEGDRFEHLGVFAEREERKQAEDDQNGRADGDEQRIDRLQNRFQERISKDDQRSVH